MHLKNKIKTTDLLAVMRPYAGEIESAVSRVLGSGIYVGGSEVGLFEKEFSEYLGIGYAAGTGSGTDALQLAFRALGLKAGDKIATVSNTAVATVAAIEMIGAVPVFVDIEPETYTMATDSLRQILEYHKHRFPRDPVKAVVPVHLYGHPADMSRIMALAKEYGVWVVEDCAQAHGAEVSGKKCGAWGHAAAFSFYPTKNMGGIGDGGALCTNDQALADNARLIKEYGWKERYISETAGINSRLDAIQAAVLRVRLKYLNAENELRIRNARKLTSGLRNTGLSLPLVRKDCKSVFHQYVIRVPDRGYLMQKLLDSGISTAVLYPQPIHLQPAYRKRIKVDAELKVTEQTCGEILCLPVHPALSGSDLQHIAETLSQAVFSPELCGENAERAK